MDPLAPIIDRLHREGRPRVWSLVMTVFGDSVQHRGGRIATARLARILGRVGIESGAMRTALSRLSHDGWVESQRSGRTSSYILGIKGRDQIAPATARIYAAPRQGPVSSWVFETTGTGIPVAGGFVRPGNTASTTAKFAIIGSLSPQHRSEVTQSLTPEHIRALTRLTEDLSDISKMTQLTPLDALAVRTLLIHRWRRLVLRWPEAPNEILPQDLSVLCPHQRVADEYTRLSPLAETWLDSSNDDLVAMPKANIDIDNRFTASPP